MRRRKSESSFAAAEKALTTIQEVVRQWAGSIPVREIHGNPRIAKRLEMVEQGVRLIEAGLEVGQ